MTQDAFGAVLHGLRARERMKQGELAEHLHVHRNTVGAWERGDYLPNLTTVHEIARLLHLSEEDADTLLAAHSSNTPLVIPWNLPALRNPLFTGREALLHHLHEMLQAPGQQAVALCGLGGMGKTQMALEYAYRFQQVYRSIFWVQAETPETLLGSYLTMADLLELPESREADQRKIEKAVHRWLQTHTDWLLIYDNVEDVARMGQELPVARSGAILLTTRAQATGSVFFPLNLDAMTPEEATGFLLRRARLGLADQYTEQPDSEVRAQAEMLADHLGRLPLALDQAGAYIEENRCSLSAYLALYERHRQLLLRQRGLFGMDHPASVATTFQLAFAQVQQQHPAAADLLRVCAYLSPEAIPEELFWQAAEDQEGGEGSPVSDEFTFQVLLKDLLRSSLIQRHPGTRSISLHRLVQEVLQDEMDQQTRQMWIERAIRRLDQLFPPPPFEEHVEDWPVCERLLAHVLACARWGEQEHISSAEIVHLCLKGLYYLHMRDQFPQATVLARQALTIRTQILGPEHQDTAESLNDLGVLCYLQGNYAEAKKLYQQALAIRERVLGKSHELVGETLHNLAVLAREQQEYAEAETLLRRALSVEEQTLGLTHFSTTTTMSQLALVCTDLGKYAEAETLYQRTLEIREQTLGPSHSHTVGTMRRIADLYRELGRYAEAEVLLRRALHLCEQPTSPNPSLTALVMDTLGQLLGDLGQYEEVEQLLQQALVLFEQTVGSLHTYTMSCQLNLAEFYRRVEKYEQAISLCQRALAASEQAFGLQHSRSADGFSLLGTISRDQEQYLQAEALLHQALVIYEQALPPTDPRTVTCLQALGVLSRRQGRAREAEDWLHRALELREARFGPNHPRLVESLSELALLCQDQGRVAEAEMFSNRALAIAQQTLGSEHPLTRQIMHARLLLWNHQ